MRTFSQYGPAIERLDAWLRSDFRSLNTQLEEAYFSAGRDDADGPGERAAKRMLVTDGAALVAGIESLPGAGRDRYELLGLVGYVLGACRRHGVDADPALDPARDVALALGGSLGVAPRYVFAHQSLTNSARAGSVRTFTTLADEAAFIRLNTLGVLAYERAAEALARVPGMGMSNLACAYLLDGAAAALADVLAANQRIRSEVDIQRFFLNIRPYFMGHDVGGTVWRGVNAGDFSAVNEIDVLLGLCDPADPWYAGILREKRPYVPPEEQTRLDALLDPPPSLLHMALAEAELARGPGWRENARRLLGIVRAHGAAYAYHHHNLVMPFLVRPADAAGAATEPDLTASGPPLDEVVTGLERLRFLRTATDRDGLSTARTDLDRLAGLVAASA